MDDLIPVRIEIKVEGEHLTEYACFHCPKCKEEMVSLGEVNQRRIIKKIHIIKVFCKRCSVSWWKLEEDEDALTKTTSREASDVPAGEC